MQLNYKSFGSGFPVIILHGLLGSLDNWQSIAKKIAEQFTVYIIDQRNHGRSPHSDEFSYDLLCADLLAFMDEHKLQQAHLIGHSMGGKVVMQFAIQHRERVAKLIVADVAPVQYGDRHSDVFNALFAADVEHAESREEVQDVLRTKLDNDETTVQFLMKGLNRDDEGKHFTWKFNAKVLWDNYTAISDAIEGQAFDGEALFIKGQKSSYITSSNYGEIMDLFPNNELGEIKDAGHWVHAEKPAEFTAEVLKFLSR